MKKYKPVIKQLEQENLFTLYGEPLVYHCNFYNLFLQRTIEDAGEYINAPKILTDGAIVAVYSMLRNLFFHNSKIRDSKTRLKIASDIYSFLGFGVLPIDNISGKNGCVQTKITHYSISWREKWEKRDTAVDYFTCGYLSAALSIAFYLPPGSFHVFQTKCLSMGDEINEFVFEYRNDFLELPNSPGIGVTIENCKNGPSPIQTNINENEILKTLKSIPMEGNKDGLIPAFGVVLTRHFANYYNYISFETERAIYKATQERELASDLFTESGHVCAFNTFGGIMISDEWYGLIYPQCKTKEDWVSGIVACVNALGWGYWTVQELEASKKLVIRVDGGYESNGYLGVYGIASNPKSFLANGAAAGIMNLLYHGDITQKPKLDEDYYSKLFKSEESFLSKQIKCRAMGERWCEFVIEKVQF